VDLRRLRAADWALAAVGIVLLVDLFQPWFAVHGVSVSRTGWESFSVVDVLVFLVALGALTIPFLTATQRSTALPLGAAEILAALSLIVALILAFRVLVDQPGLGVGLSDSQVDIRPGAWIAVLAAFALVYATYRSMRDERVRDPAGPREVPTVPAPPDVTSDA
jgi:uncharacterized membrane protein